MVKLHKTDAVILLIIILIFFSGTFLAAEEKKEAPKNIRNIALYTGVLRSEFDAEGTDMDDKSVMSGLYMQWLNPENFNINTFIYGSGDNFNEPFTGFHIMGDWYIKHPENGKYAMGAGFEYLKPDADITVDDGAGTITDTKIKNNIYIPFIRAGRYFNFDIGKSSSFSIFHWAGFQTTFVRGDGDVTIDPAGFPPAFTEDIDLDNEINYALHGIKLGLNIMHTIDLTFKYKAVFNSDDYFNNIDTMANFYFTRNLGLSLRHKFMEHDYGKIEYSIFGINYSF